MPGGRDRGGLKRAPDHGRLDRFRDRV